MKRNQLSTLGALHPILFFSGVYIVALFFSIFICSTIFYSCNESGNSEVVTTAKKSMDLSVKNSTTASLNLKSSL